MAEQPADSALKAELSASLNDLSNRFSDLGRQTEAQEATQEATSVTRPIRDSGECPDPFELPYGAPHDQISSSSPPRPLAASGIVVSLDATTHLGWLSDHILVTCQVGKPNMSPCNITVPQGPSASQPGDELNTVSIAGEADISRSQPSDPTKLRRKVVIDDFEMMCVIGKGCAGKVLLVRHKSTAKFYALKVITKGHVLAHQELQHTLTEQAVLKRMSAERMNPFVVKLWWSFHDKKNLFLVMVSLAAQLSCCLLTDYLGFPSWR